MNNRLLHWLAVPACALALAGAAGSADTIEVLGTSAGLPPPPASACFTPDCATVVSVTDLGRRFEQVSGVDGPGVYMAQDTGGFQTPINRLADSGLMEGSPVFSAQDEALAPLEGQSGMVKRANLWRVVVRFDDGSERAIQQDFPPPFQAGDRVRVDGNRIQLAQ